MKFTAEIFYGHHSFQSGCETDKYQLTAAGVDLGIRGIMSQRTIT